MSAKEITIGTLNWIRNVLDISDPETEKLAKERLVICHTCSVRTNSKCDKDKGGCGCPLAIRARSNKGCPKKKW